MKRGHWLVVALVVLVAAASFAAGFLVRVSGKPESPVEATGTTKALTIKWQRLVGDNGQTCDRCGSTQEEVHKAQALLLKSLAPLGVKVVLEEKSLDRATAAKNITESNRIWIAGKPLETWLGATSGASDCTSCGSLCGSLVQGNVECRTLTVGQSAFETIPAELIVKAGLLAAAEMVEVNAGQSCCP